MYVCLYVRVDTCARAHTQTKTNKGMNERTNERTNVVFGEADNNFST
jgi:hypothetical protein